MTVTKTCNRCRAAYPLTEFSTVRVTKRLKDGSLSTWEGPHSRCRECRKAHNRTAHARALAAERARRKRARDPECRVRERVREAERAGRSYRSREQLKESWAAGRAEKAGKRQQRLERAAFIARCMDRYRHANPDEAALLPRGTLKYRALYQYDPAFRASEIRRLHRRKNLTSNGEPLREDGSLTPEFLCQLFGATHHCAYCNEPMRSQDKTLDHIVARSRGGSHSATNVLICCRSCNAKKRAKQPSDWLQELPEGRRASVADIYHARGLMGPMGNVT